MRRIVVGLVAGLLVLAVVVVVLALRGGGSSSASPSTVVAGQSAGPASALPALPASGGGFVAPTRWIVLPAAAGVRDGLPAKFPHTPEGGVAAAVATVRAAWSWDAETSARAALAYSLPAYAPRMAEAARVGAANSRESAGVSPTGPLPDGARMTVWPIGVQWTVGADPNVVQVAVLVRVVHNVGGSARDVTTVVSTISAVVWDGADWRAAPTRGSTPPDVADLGQPGFAEAGWTAIQEGDTR